MKRRYYPRGELGPATFAPAAFMNLTFDWTFLARPYKGNRNVPPDSLSINTCINTPLNPYKVQ